MLLDTQKKRRLSRICFISVFLILVMVCVYSLRIGCENQKKLHDCEIKQSLYEYISMQENGFQLVLDDYLNYYKNPQIKTAIRSLCRQLERGMGEDEQQLSEEAFTQIYQLLNKQYNTNCVAMTIETNNGARKTIGETRLTEYQNKIWNLYSGVCYDKYYENGHAYIDLKSPIRTPDGSNIIGAFYVTIEDIHTFEIVKENYTDLPVQLAYIYNAETLDNKYKNLNYGELGLEDKMNLLSKKMEHPGIVKRKYKVQKRDPKTQKMSKENGIIYMSNGGVSKYIFILEIAQDKLNDRVGYEVCMNQAIFYAGCIVLILSLGISFRMLEVRQNEKGINDCSTLLVRGTSMGLFSGKKSQIGNRYQYYQDVEAMIEKKPQERITLLFLDLKQFKLFNFTHELAIGEMVLAQLSEYLGEQYPKHSYRLEGDKFCITLSGEEGELERVVEKINAYLEEGIELNGNQIRLCGHYGVAIYPMDSASPYELLQKADIANYYGKNELGCGNVTYYNTVMSYELNWKSDMFRYIRKAQNLDMIQLIAQNTYDLTTNQISYVKIWVKVKKPLGGEFSYDELMNMNEEIGLRGEILSNIVKKLCQYLKQQDNEGNRRNYGINIGLSQLAQESIMKNYLEEVKHQGVDYHRVWFEIYAARQGIDHEKLLLNLIRYKEMGIRIIYGSALTGNTGGVYLPDLPLYGLRLNRSLTRRWNGSAKEYEYAEGIIHAAKALQIQVIADGVDDEVIKEYVVQSGVDQARGNVYDQEREIVL